MWWMSRRTDACDARWANTPTILATADTATNVCQGKIVWADTVWFPLPLQLLRHEGRGRGWHPPPGRRDSAAGQQASRRLCVLVKRPSHSGVVASG